MSERIIDNKMSLLGDDLRQELKSGSKVRIAASCFTLFAFSELKAELSKIDELKVIFTQPTYTKSDYIADAGKREKREFFIPKQEREQSIFGTEFEIRLRNKMSLKAIAKECASWVQDKVKFASNKTSSNMQSFIAIEQPDGRKVSYSPTPQEFSASGLGFEKSTEMLTLIQKSVSQPQADSKTNPFASSGAGLFIKYFDEIFYDSKKVEDVTQQVVDSISTAYKENSPEFIYFIILYNIFTEFLDDLNEDNMPNEATGFKDTKLWSMLYDFQKDGVISIINKLEKHNGCILADSVGLGKTFTALAVILYYSLRNKSVLVLCPKRLGENWTQYSGSSNDTTNVFYQDRIRYEVLYHTDLGRTGTAHNGRNLQTINWGNYDLVVIDESHNFRNNNAQKDKETRYDFLSSRIIKAGIKTKVLMLSATPVNNRYNDLRNQLALCYGQDKATFETSIGTHKDGGRMNTDAVFSHAQRVFNEWSKKPASERKTTELIDSLSIDFKILLDSVTIARSRKNIIKYYNINDIGKFPDRLPPQSYSPDLTKRTDVPTYTEIYKHIKALSMAVYGLFDFVLDSQKFKYEQRYNVELRVSNFGINMEKGRQSGIKRLMTVNLLKRLESSVEAFRLTMRGLLDTNKDELRILERFGNGEMYPNAAVTKKVFNYEQFDADEDGSLQLQKTDSGTEVKIDYADIDRVSWKAQMERDVEILEKLLLELDKVSVEHDLKLQTLKDIIDSKIANPINHDSQGKANKKIIIFSAFADTANYLYTHISKYIKDKHNLETALITGNKNTATLKHCSKSTNHLLTMFSPISKNHAAFFAPLPSYVTKQTPEELFGKDYNKDIDILIATDCISEGQNLQDCDICINYDIHWNPVRIVQRFGRIDRLGSINKVVGLINFWPPLPLNEYINLTDRVKSRMTIVDQTATADDNLLNPDDQIDDYREVQIRKLQNGQNIDLEDAKEGISIADLGLNEFRMDAVELLKQYGEPTRVPKGMHTVLQADESKGLPKGIIFVLKNYANTVQEKSQNRLHPYYLVYLDEKGNTINTHLQVKQILDLIRQNSRGQTEPIKQAYTKFNKETDDGLKMDKYNKLLGDAIKTIVEVKETSTMLDFFAGNADALKIDKVKGLEDFELVAFVVVK